MSTFHVAERIQLCDEEVAHKGILLGNKFVFVLFGACPFFIFSINLFIFGCAVCGILVPWPGIEPEPLALEAQSQLLGHQGNPLFIYYFIGV